MTTIFNYKLSCLGGGTWARRGRPSEGYFLELANHKELAREATCKPVEHIFRGKSEECDISSGTKTVLLVIEMA
jgi:hypothetical protein